MLLGIALTAGACGGGGETIQEEAAADDVVSAGDGAAAPVDLGPDLIFTPRPGDVICDGNRKIIGEISNAKPNEGLDFDAPDTPFVLAGEARADGTWPLYWKCQPAQGNREWTISVVGMESEKEVEFVVAGRLPPPARPGGIEVEVVERPFSCDEEERVLANFSNLTPNVDVEFDIRPEGATIIDTRANEAGDLTILWSCAVTDLPRTWSLVMYESTPEPRRKTSFRFGGTSAPYQPPADIEIFEDPFVCDGEVREFAVISKFIPGEFVRFVSPQTKNLRGGNADDDGKLRIRWQCDPDQVGDEWKVTATGGMSLATVTFKIVGGAPES